MFNLCSKYQEDLEYVLEKYEENFIAPYYYYSKEEIIKFIESYISNVNIENDRQFEYFLKCLIKKINGILDNHTNIAAQRKYLPILFKMYNNELYVVNASEKNKHLMFSKLKSINGVACEVLLKEMENTISYSTDCWKQSCLEDEFCDINSLLSLPSLNFKQNEMIMEFVNEEGKEMQISSKETDEFVLDKNNCTYNVSEDTIQYVYNSCSNKYTNAVLESLESLKQIIKTNNIKYFIMDLRGNTGGNSNVIKPLIEYLSTQEFKLYAFVDRYTFSSGIMAMEDMIDLGAVTIGEGIGSSLNNFGDASEIFTLPNTKLFFRISKKYFSAKYGTISSRQEFKDRINIQDLKPVYYEPDHLVHESIEQDKKNIDIYMLKFINLKDRDITR